MVLAIAHMPALRAACVRHDALRDPVFGTSRPPSPLVFAHLADPNARQIYQAQFLEMSDCEPAHTGSQKAWLTIGYAMKLGHSVRPLCLAFV